MDTINSVSKYLLDGMTIVSYEVFYTLGDLNSDFSVSVQASEMSDPNDLNELKTIANSKASQNYVPKPTFSVVELTDLNGEVTL
jgi:hypothetical protein